MCMLTAINILFSSALRENVSRVEMRSFAADSDSFQRPAGNYGPQLKERLLILQVGGSFSKTTCGRVSLLPTGVFSGQKKAKVAPVNAHSCSSPVMTCLQRANAE